jgi:hypothetical protein
MVDVRGGTSTPPAKTIRLSLSCLQRSGTLLLMILLVLLWLFDPFTWPRPENGAVKEA